MGEGFPDFLVPLVSLGGMGVVIAAVGLYFRLAGARLIEEAGVVVVHPELDVLAVGWGGPDLDAHISVPLPAFRQLKPGDQVRIRHRPGEIEPIEILGPTVRGTFLFIIAGACAAAAILFSLVVFVTTG
jgi:hypothetical protein